MQLIDKLFYSVSYNNQDKYKYQIVKKTDFVSNENKTYISNKYSFSIYDLTIKDYVFNEKLSYLDLITLLNRLLKDREAYKQVKNKESE